MGCMNRLVYDSIATTSPYYDDTRGEEYINSSNEVVAGQSTSQQSLTERDHGPPQKINPFLASLTTHFYEKLNPFYKQIGQSDDTLVFESRFESGNLRRAIQLDKYEYELSLKSDFGTNNSTQWYFFRIQNTRKYKTY